MTAGGNSPHDLGAELPPSNFNAPGAFPPAGAPWPVSPAATPPQRQRTGLVTAGIATALAMATAALVVGGIALTRHPAPAAETSSASATDTSGADKALCEAVAPTLTDSDRVTNGYFGLGDPGTPARDAALPKFATDTLEWVKRAQAALDAHPEASPFFRRTLQRFLDDFQLLAVGLDPGPLKPHITELWYDSNSAYNGPITLCGKLGVKW